MKPSSARFTLGIPLATLWFAVVPIAQAEGQQLMLETLPYEYCVATSLKEDLADENQRYWFARVPPYVGYAKGERTTAGGDGTCYLGFPYAKSSSGVIMIDKKIIRVSPTPSPKQKTTRFRSKDGETIVHVQETGSETTCNPEGGSCCGTYIYATITVNHKGKTYRVKAANYGGG